MNEHGELPPPYEEVESTPLLPKSPQRLRRCKPRVAAAALLIACLMIIFISFYLSSSATNEAIPKVPKVPEIPFRIAIIGQQVCSRKQLDSIDKAVSRRSWARWRISSFLPLQASYCEKLEDQRHNL